MLHFSRNTECHCCSCQRVHLILSKLNYSWSNFPSFPKIFVPRSLTSKMIGFPTFWRIEELIVFADIARLGSVHSWLWERQHGLTRQRIDLDLCRPLVRYYWFLCFARTSQSIMLFPSCALNRCCDEKETNRFLSDLAYSFRRSAKSFEALTT